MRSIRSGRKQQSCSEVQGWGLRSVHRGGGSEKGNSSVVSGQKAEAWVPGGRRSRPGLQKWIPGARGANWQVGEGMSLRNKVGPSFPEWHRKDAVSIQSATESRAELGAQQPQPQPPQTTKDCKLTLSNRKLGVLTQKWLATLRWTQAWFLW